MVFRSGVVLMRFGTFMVMLHVSVFAYGMLMVTVMAVRAMVMAESACG